MENLYPKHGLVSRTYSKKRTIDQSASGKLRDLNAKESWALLENLALYDNESWNDPRDFAKPVKAIALPQDVSSTSERRLIKLENQVQRLMEAHLAPKQHTQVNKITTPCEICNGPHDTQYCIENPEQAFVEYTSSRTDEAGGEMTNKIDTVLKAITNQIADALPSNTVKNPKLGAHPVSSARSYPTDTQFSSNSSTLINAIKAHFNEAIISQTSLQQPVVEIKPQQPEEPEPTLKDEFKDLHLNLPILEVLAHALIYNDILDKYVESLELGKNGSTFVQGETPAKMGDLRLFTLPSTANAVIDYRIAKIAVGEGITRSVFGVKGVDLGEEEAPYCTTLRKRESYKPRHSSDEIGAKPPYYARKYFLDCHLPGEWEISRDAELNPFKDTLVFRRMVEFIGAIPINLKCNMWESEDPIKKPINWDKPPKTEMEHGMPRLD
ncbi:hypothetical protein Tco_0213899 [Tanacetum coccineum]